MYCNHYKTFLIPDYHVLGSLENVVIVFNILMYRITYTIIDNLLSVLKKRDLYLSNWQQEILVQE